MTQTNQSNFISEDKLKTTTGIVIMVTQVAQVNLYIICLGLKYQKEIIIREVLKIEI